MQKKEVSHWQKHESVTGVIGEKGIRTPGTITRTLH